MGLDEMRGDEMRGRVDEMRRVVAFVSVALCKSLQRLNHLVHGRVRQRVGNAPEHCVCVCQCEGGKKKRSCTRTMFEMVCIVCSHPSC